MSGLTRTRLVGLGLVLVGICVSRPAAAQHMNLSGYWNPIYDEDWLERIPGPDVGDYAGLPVTDAARLRADTWDAGLLTLPEHQCKPHPSTYGFRGVGQLRIWETRDPMTQQIIRLDTYIVWQAQHREIWMDGRPHPSENAPHSWQGFSTGTFEGDVLVVRTTHLKAGWMRRNGLPLTDQATMTERFFRHGNLMTHVSMVSDPVYLSEPLVKSNGFVWIENGDLQPYPCRPAVEVPREKGSVPHHDMGDNPFLREYAERHHIPFEAMRGGAETALPEYMYKLIGSTTGSEAPRR